MSLVRHGDVTTLMSGYNILLVEDEISLAHLVSIQLKTYGHNVRLALNSSEAKAQLKEGGIDLILLDWMMPGESGVEFLRWVRQSAMPFNKIPVIFVTALTASGNVIQALELGADDYLTKPFDEAVLVARINAVMRRAQSIRQVSQGLSSVLVLGELKVDVKAYEAVLGEERLNLTRSEFLLLKNLLEQQGCVLTREDLISKVQGTEINVTGRTVDTHIFGLRRKLKDYAAIIETIRGVGYRINEVAVGL